MKNPRLLTLRKMSLMLVCCLIVACLFNSTVAQSTVVRAVASSSSPQIGEAFTVDLTISDVQNLAGVDIILDWNSSVLRLTNVALNLGVSSHTNGVLYGNKLNYDYDTIVAGDIYVNETTTSASYELVAQSIGQSTQSFSGSGKIASLAFTVLNTGSAGLSIVSELADHPAAGEVAELIAHTDTADSIVSVPEFSGLIVIVLLIAASSAVVVASKKNFGKF